MTPQLAIRMAMMGGVLLFGGVSWFVHQSAEWQPAPPEDVASLVQVGRVMWLAIAAGLAILYRRARGEIRSPQLAMLAILAWALGETLALFGGVLFYLSGRSVWYVAGVLVLALTFVAFPGRRAG